MTGKKKMVKISSTKLFSIAKGILSMQWPRGLAAKPVRLLK